MVAGGGEASRRGSAEGDRLMKSQQVSGCLQGGVLVSSRRDFRFRVFFKKGSTVRTARVGARRGGVVAGGGQARSRGSDTGEIVMQRRGVPFRYSTSWNLHM